MENNALKTDIFFDHFDALMYSDKTHKLMNCPFSWKSDISRMEIRLNRRVTWKTLNKFQLKNTLMKMLRSVGRACTFSHIAQVSPSRCSQAADVAKPKSMPLLIKNWFKILRCKYRTYSFSPDFLSTYLYVVYTIHDTHIELLKMINR